MSTVNDNKEMSVSTKRIFAQLIEMKGIFDRMEESLDKKVHHHFQEFTLSLENSQKKMQQELRKTLENENRKNTLKLEDVSKKMQMFLDESTQKKPRADYRIVSAIALSGIITSLLISYLFPHYNTETVRLSSLGKTYTEALQGMSEKDKTAIMSIFQKNLDQRRQNLKKLSKSGK